MAIIRSYNKVFVIRMINLRAHLTTEGFDQIRQIKAGMNRGRDVE